MVLALKDAVGLIIEFWDMGYLSTSICPTVFFWSKGCAWNRQKAVG
jgi:hypothetical protein